MDDASKKPSETRGRPFEPGNPGGPSRPAGSRNKATLVLDQIADDAGKAILERMVEAAKGGDMRAAELVLQRIWPARKSRPIALTLPAIQSAADVVAAAPWSMPRGLVTSPRTRARRWHRSWRPSARPLRQWIWKHAYRRSKRSGNEQSHSKTGKG